jgi:hypothetical protein
MFKTPSLLPLPSLMPLWVAILFALATAALVVAAMAVAMIYPEPEKGGRGKKSAAQNSLATSGFSRQLLDQARAETNNNHRPTLR